jgi:hypothetical protein
MLSIDKGPLSALKASSTGSHGWSARHPSATFGDDRLSPAQADPYKPFVAHRMIGSAENGHLPCALNGVNEKHRCLRPYCRQ